MPVIRIDDDVFRELQLRAQQGFKDRPNYVIRRLLKIDTESTGGSGFTVFELLVQYLEGKPEAMNEIHRRFRTFGWVRDNKTLLTPQQMETHKRRCEAAMRAVATKRRKYKKWPTRRNDHK